MTRFKLLVALVTLTSMTTQLTQAQPPWEAKLKGELPLLGHRNWIVIADSAYPLQTAPGIETVYADTDQLEAVKFVLRELSKTKHVRPIIYTDNELNFVPEKDAPGIGDYRTRLRPLLKAHSVQELPHEAIIKKLDESGKTFRILLIKTHLTLPYTSVFLELDCGYWNSDAEKRLRDSMKASGSKAP